ncbi:hypothetical protein B9J76_13515 [Lacticaseibacillus paracasei]|nr:hypothetical protein B9J76_13515 [Lacticaseibacillus paracasei]
MPFSQLRTIIVNDHIICIIYSRRNLILKSYKYCSNCGKKIPKKDNFCNFCGARQEIQEHQDVSLKSFSQNNQSAERYPNLISSTELAFNKILDFGGRTSLADFWWGTLGISLLYLALFALISIIPDSDTGNGLLFIVDIPFTLISLSLTIRRLHDIGKSGWFYCLNFIPLVGNIIVIILCCQPAVHKIN